MQQDGQSLRRLAVLCEDLTASRRTTASNIEEDEEADGESKSGDRAASRALSPRGQSLLALMDGTTSAEVVQQSQAVIRRMIALCVTPLLPPRLSADVVALRLADADAAAPAVSKSAHDDPLVFAASLDYAKATVDADNQTSLRCVRRRRRVLCV